MREHFRKSDGRCVHCGQQDPTSAICHGRNVGMALSALRSAARSIAAGEQTDEWRTAEWNALPGAGQLVSDELKQLRSDNAKLLDQLQKMANHVTDMGCTCPVSYHQTEQPKLTKTGHVSDCQGVSHSKSAYRLLDRLKGK